MCPWERVAALVPGIEVGMCIEPDCLELIAEKIESLLKEIEELRGGIYYGPPPEDGKSAWYIRQEFMDRAHQIMKERNAKSEALFGISATDYDLWKENAKIEPVTLTAEKVIEAWKHERKGECRE